MIRIDEVRAVALLHAWVCQAAWWSEDCRRPDGGPHARATMRPLVKAASKTPDPVAYLHDHLCAAELDGVIRGCPERDRHIAHLARVLGVAEQGAPLALMGTS